MTFTRISCIFAVLIIVGTILPVTAYATDGRFRT